MFCKGCGNQLNDGEQFCPRCGHIVGNQTMGASAQPNVYSMNPAGNTNSEKNNKKKHTVPIVIGILAFVIAMGTGGFFWLRSQDGTKSTSSTNEEKQNDDKSSRRDRNKSDSKAPINKLIGYIDQAEELMSQTYNDVNALFEEDSTDVELIFAKQVEILATSLSNLSDLQNQADAISGMEANLENAKKEYFSMAYDSLKAFYSAWNFLEDYAVLTIAIAGKPQTEYYDTVAEYYNDFYDWYTSVEAVYSEIDSCPSSLESEWKKYENILSLNISIIQKFNDAKKYNDEEIYDILRIYSAMNMSDRYNAVTDLQDEAIWNVLYGEMDFFIEQMSWSFELAEEIRAYAKLDEEDRSEYEFKNIYAGEISLDYDVVDTIYPSLYNTYDAFLIIKTGCISGTRKIVVEAEIPGLTQTYKESFTLDSAYRTIYIKPPALTGDLDLKSTKNAQINVTISEQNGTLIEAKTFPVTIQSKYDFDLHLNEYGVATQDNFLCFLTPEAPAISQLKRQAINEISNITDGRIESFAGYQEVGSSYGWDHYVTTYLQVAGLMRAMNVMGVRYLTDTFSISEGHQHVLFPEDVLDQQGGLCVETSLVVASALQSADMHAFLVFPPGHAQVAVEIWNYGEGKGEYFLIETTCVDDASNNQNIFIDYLNEYIGNGVLEDTYPIAYLNSDEWINYISNNNAYIIDCNDSSVLGLTPFAN